MKGNFDASIITCSNNYPPTLCLVPGDPRRRLHTDLPAVGPLRPRRHLRPQRQDGVSAAGCRRHIRPRGTEASHLTWLLLWHRHLQTVAPHIMRPIWVEVPRSREDENEGKKNKKKKEAPPRESWTDECGDFKTFSRNKQPKMFGFHQEPWTFKISNLSAF